PDQHRRPLGEGPEPGPVDPDQPVMGDRLAGQQGPGDLDGPAEAGPPLGPARGGVPSPPPSGPGLPWPPPRGGPRRSALGGQRSPVMCSLEASPLPRASQKRPGNISLRVAAAWATIAGGERCPGAFPPPRLSRVACRAPPSQAQANPLCPCRGLQGAKWSEHI